MTKLTEKQKKFADEYMISLNAAQAAIKAGYSKKNACKTGSENLTKPDIQLYMRERQKELQKQTQITQQDVIRELAKIGFSNITDFVEIKGGCVTVKDTSQIPQDKVGAIASIEKGSFGIKLKLYSKLDALEKIGRHLGMFGKTRESKGVEDLEPLARMLHDDEI